MKQIGFYYNRKVFWFDYKQNPDQFPDADWVCLTIANNRPDYDAFEIFIRKALSKSILEFKGWGKFGEQLHNHFDEIVSLLEVMENHAEINVMTTWHNNQTLADAFWECFFVTCLPETADMDNITIVCTDLDGIDRSDELKRYIEKFGVGWLPD